MADAIKGADVFCGVSVKGIVTKEMVKSMADKPIVFAIANPDPEITYEDATSARDDIIMATGRSDYPNQVNNVLGFPFTFRGALDVRASAINTEMKIAAMQALARLAKDDVPDSVVRAYGEKRIEFGREDIIPKPFDPRVLLWEATAVARAAMESGVARAPIKDFEAYRDSLEARLGTSREVMRVFIHRAQKAPKRIVFPARKRRSSVPHGSSQRRKSPRRYFWAVERKSVSASKNWDWKWRAWKSSTPPSR